ncbi:MAG: hypothetical protein ABIF06_01325 [bacterium]
MDIPNRRNYPMFKKITGGAFLSAAFALVINAMARWIPLVVAWAVETGQAVALTSVEAWNAFTVFQANDPALAGLVSLIAGAVFAVVGYALFRDKPDDSGRTRGGFSFGRADREASEWEREQGVGQESAR